MLHYFGSVFNMIAESELLLCSIPNGDKIIIFLYFIYRNRSFYNT